MGDTDGKEQRIRFAYLKYIQMAESLGFYPSKEQEPDFDPFLTNQQVRIRYENARNWFNNKYRVTSNLHRLIFGNSSDLKKVRRLLKQQNFEVEQIHEILNLLRDS